MSPLPADAGPFVARERPAAPPPAASAGLAPPFVAGAASGEERDAAILPPDEPAEAYVSPILAEEPAELPWLSESVSALSGLADFGDDLANAGPAPSTGVPGVEPEDAEPMQHWDDELGTVPLSEELPELVIGGVEIGASGETRDEEGVGSWPNYALPIVTPVPSAALEDVARRLEKIARTLRARGPTGPLEENSSDPLGALITGYLLGVSGSEKGRE